MRPEAVDLEAVSPGVVRPEAVRHGAAGYRRGWGITPRRHQPLPPSAPLPYSAVITFGRHRLRPSSPSAVIAFGRYQLMARASGVRFPGARGAVSRTGIWAMNRGSVPKCS
ncbi:hypothetical protein GCM10009850_106510 [Nonomuraea monospora]|uniref:Uncharacterized protein n=1 Tax=Nonomuraea monospora TaxID=568818 RepID=A0ABN3D0U5_9ACTN